jgi:hypothetical protein
MILSLRVQNKSFLAQNEMAKNIVNLAIKNGAIGRTMRQ